MKFGRIYTMTIQGREETHTINFPLTCRFRVSTNSLYSAGQATFMIFNLSADVRSDLYKDPFEQGIYKQIVFHAGYQQITPTSGIQSGPSIPLVFQGNVLTAFSYRQGPDWITEINALDGGYSIDNSTIDLTKPSPYDIRDVLTNAVASMSPSVSLGTIGDFSVANSRGITFSGSPWDLITQLIEPLQGQAFINNEKVYILRQWEYIEDVGGIDVISAETGMIGTPRFQEAIVKVRTIFEPRLEIAQQVELQTVESRMSGAYKVLSLVHSGTISGAVCEELTTEITLFQPDRDLEAA